MRRHIISGAVAIAAWAGVFPTTSASAAPLTWDWSGFYIGVNGGYAWGDAKYSFFATNFFAPVGSSWSHSISGGMIGGHVGYNYQLYNWVVGIEGSFDWTAAGRTLRTPWFPASDSLGTRVKWVATVTPRLGYTGGNWLIYGKAGVAFASIENEGFDIFGDVIQPVKTSHTGGTVGVGVEYSWTSNWILGVEYNYYHFGRKNVAGFLLDPTGFPIGNFRHEKSVTLNSLLARLSYKFSMK